MRVRFLFAALGVSAAAVLAGPGVWPGLGQTPPGTAEERQEPGPAAEFPRPVEPPPAESAAETRTPTQARPAGEPEGSRETGPRTAASLDFEEAVLDDRIAIIEEHLTETTSRVDSVFTALELGVLKVQKETLGRRRELEAIRSRLSEQERLTAQDLRNKQRLVELVERYGAGDWVARHIKVELEKFRHRTQRSPVRATDEELLRQRLREYRQSLFELGTRLFRVDSEARDLAQALSAEMRATPAVSARLDSLLSDRKRALQAQERVLDELAVHTTRLADLVRQREDHFEGLYTLVLGRMLWLRNREPVFHRALFGHALDGAAALAGRLSGWPWREWQIVQIRFAASSWPWAAAVLVFAVAPWLAVHARRLLGAPRAVPAHRAALLLAGRAAVWPAFIILVTWSLPQFGLSRNDALGPALAGALQVAALVLWIALFGRALFRSDGHGERRWGLTPEAGRLLRTGVVAGCAAALVLLVPRHVLLNAPGDDVAESLALARLLMVAFALVVLALVAVGLRRRGALMQTVLRHSRSQEGFLWSVWPLVHLVAAAVLAGTVVLNLAGYQYASQFIWQRIMATGLVVLVALWLSFYLKSAVRAVWQRVVAGGGAPAPQGGRADTAHAGLLCTLVDLPLALLAAVVLLETWGVSVMEFFGTPAGGTVLARAGLIALVIAAGLGLIRLSNATVLSLLRPRVLDLVGSREAGRRLQTLAPLAQTSVKLLVVLVGFLLILQLVGVETGPLLAGVGIFGLAVGFAAQSLIKDVINGLFILTEGSLGAGDVVDVGGVAGVVEKVTLRSVRIRDLSGNVHFVPNSTIEHVQNMTKDYSRYLLDVGVGYREDTDEVVAVMKEVDETMRRDPQFRRDMLEPIEILGVDRFEDSAVIVRGRLKTRPVEQWRIGREYNRRLKKAFDERGIEIPFPHRTVYWGETKQGQPPLQVEHRSPAPTAPPGAPEAEKQKEGEPRGTKQFETES